VIQRPVRTRRLVSAVILAAMVPVVASCGLEAKDETSKEHAAIQAASNHIGPIDIRNAFISNVADATGTIRPYLVATLVNNGPQDTLTAVSTSIGTGTLDDTDAAAGGITLPTNTQHPVQLSDPNIDGTDPSVTIDAQTLPTDGTTVTVTLTFAAAGQIKAFAVPVVDDNYTLNPTESVPTNQATPPAEDAPPTSD
jgi:hypothetical protein